MYQSDTPSSPIWRPFADQVIQRLRTGQPDADSDPWLDGYEMGDSKGGATPPGTADQHRRPILDEMLRARDFPHLPPDFADDLRETDADPQATLITGVSRPATRLASHDLSIAIRLAAMIGSAEALQSVLAPDAITFITGIDGADISVAERVLRTGILPPGMKTCDIPRKASDTTALLLLTPDSGDAPVNKTALARHLERIDRAMDWHIPIIALLPDAADLPHYLRQGDVSTILHLAAPNREMLITHLCYTHSATGRIDERAVRAALPDDQHMTSLPFAALRIALRAPTALAVAKRIATVCEPHKSAHGVAHLDEMAGDTPALTAARQLVADLALWQNGRVAWSDLSRSMLLYGPPGTGKTWLARAMGNAAGIGFEEASFAGWQSAGHLGDLLREMRKSFATARGKTPCILFIDEIDAIGSRNDGDKHGSNYRIQVINAFLSEMDTISRDAGVIVIGACNDPDRIDPALLRAGRFDIKVQVPLPGVAMIKGILRRHLAEEMSDDTLHSLATDAVGNSAAEIDAGVRAARAEARHSTAQFSATLIRKHLGISKDPRQIAVDWRVAVHECGHAIVATSLGRGEVHRILITKTGGETHRRDTPNEGLLCDLSDEITCKLAGRVAERLMFGDVSAGAGGGEASDLAVATRLALSIETTLGLGASGTIYDSTPDLVMARDPSVRARVQQRLDDAESRARAMLAAQEDLLREMARTLLHKRELGGPTLQDLLARVASKNDAVADLPITRAHNASPCASLTAQDSANQPHTRRFFRDGSVPPAVIATGTV